MNDGSPEQRIYKSSQEHSSNALAKIIKENPRLEELDIFLSYFFPEHIEMLGNLTRLRSLRMRFYADAYYPPFDLRFVRTMYSLEHLALTLAGPLSHWAEIATVKGLRSLELSTNSCHGQVMFSEPATLEPLKRLYQLREVILGENLGKLTINLDILASLPQLTNLRLSNTESTEITSVKSVRRATQLRSLCLGATSVPTLAEVWGMELEYLGTPYQMPRQQYEAYQARHPNCCVY